MNQEFKNALKSAITKNNVQIQYNAADHTYIVTNAQGKELIKLCDNHTYGVFTIIVDGKEVFKEANSTKSNHVQDLLNACREKISGTHRARGKYVKLTPIQMAAVKFLKQK